MAASVTRAGGAGVPLRSRGAAWLRRKALGLLARTRYPGVSFGTGCDVRSGLHLTVSPGARVAFGPGTVLDRGLTVECHGTLEVGRRTVFGHHVTIGVRDRVTIGEACLIAEMVSIRDHDHRFHDLDRPILDQGAESAPVTIGHGVWIGAKATVVKGVTIGDDAVIGAGAVVTRDVPSRAVALGVPARVVRYRDGSPAT
jgi:acetyltransferase-like isoleucine patch superfamily enzyme